jgi:hypothetical protein
VLAVNGTIPATPTILTISTQFNNLTSIKVDGLGNLYLSSVGSTSGAGALYKVVAVNGSIPASPTIQTLSTAIGGPTGIAVDSSGNLYVSDQIRNAAFEIMAVNGSIPASPAILTLATGLLLPSNITLDAAGDVFVSDYGDSDVKEILAVNGSIPASSPTILSLGSGLVTPQGVFVDQSGNVFVADSGLTQAVEINYANPPTLNFASTVVGQTSSDSPQTVSLSNDGNAPLLFAALRTADISQSFTLGGASTCPHPPIPGGQVFPSASCTYLVSFTPVSPGMITGELVIDGGTLNNYAATQIVPLNGVALNLTDPTITFSVPNQTLGMPPFTIAAVSNSPGAITYSVLSGPATVSGSIVTLSGAGIVELLASQAASGIYASGTATATFNVARQPQTITFATLTSPVPSGAPPATLAATASSGLPVAFSVISGPATISGAMLTFVGTGTVVVAANQSGNAQYAAAPAVTQTVMVDPQPNVILTATPNPVFLNNPVTLTAMLSVSGPAPSGKVMFLDGTQPIGTATLAGQMASIAVSTLSVGTHSITASYGGNANYASAASPPIMVIVEDFSLALANNNVTIFHGGTATFTLSLAATNAMTLASTVSLAVTGQPEGSQVTLTPASIATGSGATPVTLVIQTPNYPAGPFQVGRLRGGVSKGSTLAALLVLGGVLLPWGSGRRLRLRRLCGGLLVTLAFVGLEGCGSGWKTQVWTINVTATSGQLSHKVSATLTSECKDGEAACPIVNQ